jgi:hypothetical protein
MPQKRDHAASGSAIAAGGAVTAGTGLAAGGIPGVKSNVKDFIEADIPNMSPKGTVKALIKHPKAAKALPGGIFGFRHNAHAGGLYGYKQKATEEAWKGEPKHAHDAFFRGRNVGKIEPEEQVLRHLKGGKKVAGAAAVGGAALTAYGVHRARKVSKADRTEKGYQGALLGGGATLAGVAHGGKKVLDRQDRKWSAESAKNVKTARGMVPGLAHPKRGPDAEASLRDADLAVRKDPNAFKGIAPHVAQEAGRLRGAAIQQAHFANVYRGTGKAVGHLRAPGLVAAAAGAGGLALSRKKKSPMSKRMSAFGVVH